MNYVTKEQKAEYDKQRYQNGLKKKIFGDRRCRACDCFLAGRFGACKTRAYCRSCRDNGTAKRHTNQLYYQANRERLIERARRQPDRKAYLRDYAKRRRELNNTKRRVLELENMV